MKDNENHPRIFTQTFCVVGAIIEQDGKILLVQEAQGLDKRKWNQPAGWVDPAEDPFVAVRREIKEETGFDFEPTAIVGVYSLVKERLRKRVAEGVPHGLKIIYKGLISNQTSELDDDIAAIGWFTPAEIFAMDESTLRDIDIKQEVRDCLAGKTYPLDLVRHTVQN